MASSHDIAYSICETGAKSQGPEVETGGLTL